MRVIPALLFSIATSAGAQYTYIVPVAGFALGFENISSTFVHVVNPNVTPATLRYQAVYPMRPLIPFSACALRPAIVLAPHAVYDDLPRACHEGLHAVVLTSDQPIEVRAEVFYGVFRNQSVVSNHFEPLDVARDWTSPDMDVLIPLVKMYDGYSHANLFIINPNDVVLTVNVHVDRPEARATRDLVVHVEPQSLSLTPVPMIPVPGAGPDPIVVDGIHNLTLHADGRFYAGVSALTDGSPVFRAPIPLQR